MDKDITKFLTALADTVKTARKARKMTQAQLAEKSGLDPMSVKRAENPKIAGTGLRLSTFILLMRALHLNPNSVVYPELKENSPTKEELLGILTADCSEEDCKFIRSAFLSLVKMAHSRNTTNIEE